MRACVTTLATVIVTVPCVASTATIWLRLPASAFPTPLPQLVLGATIFMCGRVVALSMSESKLKLKVIDTPATPEVGCVEGKLGIFGQAHANGKFKPAAFVAA